MTGNLFLRINISFLFGFEFGFSEMEKATVKRNNPRMIEVCATINEYFIIYPNR